MIRAALEPRGRFSLVLVQSGTDHNESRALLGLQLSYSVWPPSCLCFHPANKKTQRVNSEILKAQGIFFGCTFSRTIKLCNYIPLRSR